MTEAIGALCDCDVAASDDDTGHAALGGDWDLEYATGVIETDVAFSADLQQNWAHVMALETVLDTFTTVSYGNNDGSAFWAGGWIETDSSGGGATNGRIRVEAGELEMKTKTTSESIYREVDLSTAVWAELSYEVDSSLSGDTVRVDIYDGGSWNILVD